VATISGRSKIEIRKRVFLSSTLSALCDIGQ